MLPSSTALAILGLVPLSLGSLLPLQQHLFTNPEFESSYRIPTVHESAVQARRILRLENIGTLSTVFPSDSSHPAHTNEMNTRENRPEGLGGTPIGLMDYYADCETSTGNPTILAIGIATSFKNVAAGSNITLSLRYHPQDGRWHSAAALPRYSLIGHLEDITESEASKAGLATCFVKSHPDAVAWLPGNRIHESHWVRLVVDDVYWIGGFGDRAYIGWIPLGEWISVTEAEVDRCRLPGEKTGWSWESWL
ncbi:pyridoxamine 5'-phosphate oxidase-domain-containing protein [Delphinella strobiligena]|nr:pyridoxamine 5'-phosphate oxidase-domain-containing protein [Delphinella strobiligena]